MTGRLGERGRERHGVVTRLDRPAGDMRPGEPKGRVAQEGDTADRHAGRLEVADRLEQAA